MPAPKPDDLDSAIGSYGTFGKKKMRQQTAANRPAAPPKPKAPPQVPLKQAMKTFDSANDFLKPGYGKPKVKMPTAPPKPTAVKKATRGR